MRRFRLRGVRVTPSLVISMLALFVALSSTGFAADIVPLAKRALTADKAKVATKANDSLKLQGATAAQVAAIPGPATDAQTLNGQTAAQIAAAPGPVSALPASLFTLRSDSWSVDGEGRTTRVTASCNAGEKAIAGGWDQAEGAAYVITDRPLTDGSGWRFAIWAESGDTLPANGSVWAICAKVTS